MQLRQLICLSAAVLLGCIGSTHCVKPDLGQVRALACEMEKYSVHALHQRLPEGFHEPVHASMFFFHQPSLMIAGSALNVCCRWSENFWGRSAALESAWSALAIA